MLSIYNIIRILKMRIVTITVDNIDYMHIKILYKLIAVNYVIDFKIKINLNRSNI